MFGTTWRVGRIGGVELRVDASWALIAALIAYSLYLRFDYLYPHLATGEVTVLALGAAVVFFGSVLLHELAHAWTARSMDVEVEGITLFLFGGATHARLESRGPRAEFVITVVGPLTSLAIAFVLWLVSLPLSGALEGALGYLAWVNAALAVFNLLPGFPLDGGRVLRSAVWGATGDLNRATRVASQAGQMVGYGLIGIGLLMMFTGGLGGLWIAAIGWFLSQAAQASYGELHAKRLLQRIRAEDVMNADLVELPGDLTVAEAVDRYFLRYDHGAFPVVDTEGRPLGLLGLRGVRQIAPEQRATTLVRDCAAPLDGVVVAPRTAMDVVLQRFSEGGQQRVLVEEDGRLLGIITPNDLARWLRRYEELGMGRGERAG